MVDTANSSTFASLGVCAPLAAACERLGWHTPTAIQASAIPLALQGKDVIGLAATGSGKTGSFALPLLQDLIEKPSAFHSVGACTDTRTCISNQRTD